MREIMGCIGGESLRPERGVCFNIFSEGEDMRCSFPRSFTEKEIESWKYNSNGREGGGCQSNLGL